MVNNNEKVMTMKIWKKILKDLFKNYFRYQRRKSILIKKNKWNELKWNEMKWNEMKWNEMKWHENLKRNEIY